MTPPLASRLLEVRAACALAALASALVLGAAFFMQYVVGLAPCPLCIAQRWPYAAAIVLGLTGLVPGLSPNARRAVLGLAALAFLVGTGIAVYHAGIEQGWFAGPDSCSGIGVTGDSIEELRRKLMDAPVVRCDEVPWSLFGISMAGYNAAIGLILGAFAATAALRRRRPCAIMTAS